jgi:hypothetical protein
VQRRAAAEARLAQQSLDRGHRAEKRQGRGAIFGSGVLTRKRLRLHAADAHEHQLLRARHRRVQPLGCAGDISGQQGGPQHARDMPRQQRILLLEEFLAQRNTG